MSDDRIRPPGKRTQSPPVVATSEVRIVMSRQGLGQVFIAGHEIKRVQAIRFSAGVGQLNRLHLVIAAETVTVDAAATVRKTERPP
jgi:hypothetical protein